MQISSAEFVKSYASSSDLPPHPVHVAFFGRSNVGKSSLINSLCNQKTLSRTSATPGRTQLINLFLINKTFYLVDLPGYGFAKTSKTKKEAFQQLIIDYLNSDAPLKLAVLITDSRHEPTSLDLAMIESVKGRGVPMIIIANKTDKLTRNQLAITLKKLHAQFPGDTVIGYSSETKHGRSELLAAIESNLR